MTCGLGLGILLICIVQVEHVCSLAVGAQSYQNSVGFPLADGLRRYGSNPQNQLRQGLISPRMVQSSSSFSAEPVVKSGYGQGLFTRSHTQALPQPAQSTVRKVKSSLLKLNRQSSVSPWASAPAEPQRPVSPRASAPAEPQRPVSPWASAPAEPQRPVSPRASAPAEPQRPVSPRASAPAEPQRPVSPRASAPAEPKHSFGLSTDIVSGSSVSQRSEKLKDLEQKGSWSMPQPRMHLSSSSRSAQSPSGERLSSARQSVADSRSSSPSGENYSFRLASLPSAARKTSNAAPKPSNYKQMGSSAVLFGPVAPGPRERYARMQTFARGPAKRVVSSRRSGGPKHAVFSPRMESSEPYEGLGSYRPLGQKQIYQPSSVSKGVYNMAFPRSSRVETSAMGFAPVTVHDIPNRLGGSSIRRLKEPVDQNKERVRKLQQTYPQSPHLPHGRSGWSRIQVHTV